MTSLEYLCLTLREVLSRTCFPQEKSFQYIIWDKVMFSFYKRLSTDANGGNVINTSLYDHEVQRNIKNTSDPEFSFKVICITNKKRLFNICFLLSIFLCRDFFCLKGSFYVLIYFQRKSVIKISICAIFCFQRTFGFWVVPG